jgi:hypothetical protein
MAKINFRTGNFSLDIEGELNEDQKAKALENGITYIVQRDVASAAYRQIAGEGEKKTLPKGFERSSVEFNDENAAAVEAAFTKAMEKYGTFTVSVSKHEPSEGAGEPGKMATAMWEQVKGNDALRGNLGVAADATDEQGIEACRNFLSGLRKPAAKKAA